LPSRSVRSRSARCHAAPNSLYRWGLRACPDVDDCPTPVWCEYEVPVTGLGVTLLAIAQGKNFLQITRLSHPAHSSAIQERTSRMPPVLIEAES
jgi:hypothetical protein